MLTVTPAARECLSARLARKQAADDVAMRFTRRKGGWRLRPDQAGAADTAFTHEGRSVLLLDEAVSKAMANMTLDTKESGPRTGLKLFRNDRSED
ncbi:MAG: hypothetical protein GY778_28315 [bacterium]|nr:hypothetical protein [bacterium]